jgi:hypothetical protein
VSMSDDPDKCKLPSSDESQGAELEIRKPDTPPTATDAVEPEVAADGHPDIATPASPTQDGSAPVLPAEALTVLLESIVPGGILVRNAEVERDVKPMARNMDPIDLGIYILASRYRTINAVLVLLAVAVCVAALAFGSHNNPISIISLTSAGTVAVTLGVSAVKKRHERRQDSKPDEDAAKHKNDSSA